MNCPHCQREIDLHEHAAEVRKPLELALRIISDAKDKDGQPTWEAGFAADALAKANFKQQTNQERQTKV